MSEALLKKLTKILKEKIDQSSNDFDWYLDDFLGKKQYNHNQDILVELVDSFIENEKKLDSLEINIMIKFKDKEYDHLAFMFHPIDEEDDDYSFFLKVILDKNKKEEFSDLFQDTHGQKCKVYIDENYLFWGIYNTGPYMVDRKLNPEPPWRDEAMNRNVDGMMKLGVTQVKYLIPIFEEYCYTDEGLNIPDDGLFKDENGRECVISYSSIATYEGMWIGDKEFYRMHMNIPKIKNILEKMKEYLEGLDNENR